MAQKIAGASLNEALVKVALEIQNPKFDDANPHFKNRFASLKAVMDVIRPLCAEHGIAVHQELITGNEGVGCITHLRHVSGEALAYGPFILRPTKDDPQGAGSAATYARRYQALAALGIVGEADDDGNAASVPRKKMPEKQAKELSALLDAANLETGEGVSAFAEAWIELDQDEQLAFAPWVPNFYPGNVSKTKEHMRNVIRKHRLGAEAL